MGILRVYLALCVITTHSTHVFPWQMHGGREAVQLFFLVSGFYMQLIAGKYRSIQNFYFSRFFRIYIPYWATAFVLLLAYLILNFAIGYLGPLECYRNNLSGAEGKWLASLFSVTILGQDLIMFLKQPVGESLGFTLNWQLDGFPLCNYLIIPQAWSIALELQFYLLVPFLSRLKSQTLAAIVIISILLRVLFYEAFGLSNDPWNYRFFPFEIAIFIMGMLSCRFYQKYVVNLKLPEASTPFKYITFSVAMLIILWLLSGITDTVKLTNNYSELLSYFLWLFIIPFIFIITKNTTSDRWIGELSYPVYLTHYAIIWFVSVGNDKLNLGLSEEQIGPVTAVSSILVSIVLVMFLIKPIDIWRAKLFMGRAA